MPYRSRLQNLEEKRNIRKAFLLIAGTIILIIIAILAGIPALVKLAVFISEVSSANRPITKSDNIPPVPPVFDIPYDATNSATISVQGRAESGSTVALTLNDESAGSVVVSDQGVFHFAEVDLIEGENLLVAAASDQAGNISKPSANVTVYYSRTAPEIKIETPTDNQSINAKEVEIKGQVTPGSRLTINERTVIIGSDGRFVTKYNLTSGENALVFVASDKAGNQSRSELTVISTQ